MEEKAEYSFVLTVGRESSTLLLKKGEEGIGEKSWKEDRDMGKRLFESIEELLQKSRLAPKDVTEFGLEAAPDVLESSTSLRIAETVQKVYTFAVSRSRSSGEEEET